jgi:effector-binding domain-containing protein
MKALLKILYFFLVLIVLFLLVGIILPKKSHVESSTLINASPEIIFGQVNSLKNWEIWSPWQAADPSFKLTYRGPVSGVGAAYSWTSDHSGAGIMSITESIPYSYLQIEVDFGERGSAKVPWHFEQLAESTKVTWAFDNEKMSYFERYFMILFKKNMMNTFSNGLAKLKEVCEELRLNRVSDVKEIELVKRHALIITDSAYLQDIGIMMDRIYEKLMNYLEKRKLQQTGPPFTVYYKLTKDGFSTFACGIPIAEKTWGWKEYAYMEMPQCKAVTVTHWGKYNSMKPYETLDNYIKNNGLKLAGPPWEEYINDPKTETDTSKWETNVYYPIE